MYQRSCFIINLYAVINVDVINNIALHCYNVQ